MEWKTSGGRILKLTAGDITRIPADAIVNAANSALAGGGGVDGAIHRAGGPSLMRELDAIRTRTGPCPAGSAVVTGAGALPARFVFHAVGPVYRGGRHGEAQLLASCYRKCLELAEERDLRVVSFPAISTGVYGYPMEEAADIALATVAAHLETEGTGVREAAFVLFGSEAYEIWAARLGNLRLH